MRVCVVPSDQGGCGYYRMIWPARALKEQGVDVHISNTEEAAVLRADEFDVIVIQRPLRLAMYEHVQAMQENGIAVVVDMDDDFSCLDPLNVSYRAMQPQFNPKSNYQHCARTCAIADMVTTSTTALASRYGQHGRVSVLSNYVPDGYFDTPKDDSIFVRVAWSGSVYSHPNDLQVTRGAVASAINRTGAVFLVVGTAEGVGDRLGFEKMPDATGWLDINGEYQKAMANVDVGIVPLSDTAFNAAKSWLKGLEWASLGVPFVASPTPEYLALEKLGAGITASNRRRWDGSLTHLIKDETFRKELSESGLEAARQLTYENNAHKWAEAWEQAVVNRKMKQAA